MSGIHRGINLRELERIWIDEGGTVTDVNRTGERRLVTANGRRSAAYNCRRKDAPLALVQWAKRALEEAGV